MENKSIHFCILLNNKTCGIGILRGTGAWNLLHLRCRTSLFPARKGNPFQIPSWQTSMRCLSSPPTPFHGDVIPACWRCLSLHPSSSGVVISALHWSVPGCLTDFPSPFRLLSLCCPLHSQVTRVEMEKSPVVRNDNYGRFSFLGCQPSAGCSDSRPN